MLTALYKTFHWPGLQVTFYYEGRPVAVFSASRTLTGWFALPHSDSFGFQVVDVSESGYLGTVVPAKTDVCQIIGALIQKQGLYEGAGSGVITKYVELTDNDLIKGILNTNHVHSIKTRSTEPTLPFNSPQKVINVLDLSEGMDGVLGRFTSNIRRKIRKATRNGIVVKEGGTELINPFYYIYRKGIHRHGSFGLPRKFFNYLLEDEDSMPGPKARLFVAFYQNKPVGGALLLSQSGFSENNAFATLPGYNHLYTSYALHQAMIGYSIDHGITRYSFGRSTSGSAVSRFKQQFGGVELPLYYSSHKNEMGMKLPGKTVGKIIRALPQTVVQWLDGFVAKKVY